MRRGLFINAISNYGAIAYPKVNLDVSAAAKFSVANLEGDGHLVVLVKRFVETFTLVGLHLNAVRQRRRQQAARRSKKGKGREPHDCRGRVLSTGDFVNIHGDASCCPQMQGCRQNFGR